MLRCFTIVASGLLASGLALAFNNGADPGHSGVPGEQTCAQATCHVGTALNPAGGSVAVEFPSGLTYVPGTRQRLTVRMTDPQARVFGFQVTIRLASNSRTNAGTLTVESARNTFVWCSTADFTRQTEKPAAGCPANQPIESIQQSEPLAAPANTWTFFWDPPATAQGEVVVYVAGNGANGNGQNSGDRIYTNSYRLQPGTGGGGANRPTISQGGVITAGAFGAATTIAPGSWIEIYGTNLATETRQWGGNDFSGNNAPTVLGGVRVSIGGTPAFVQLISPGQINAQVPGGLSAGPTTMTVTNAAGTSDNYNITVAARSPGLLSPPVFRVNNRQYLAALFPDNTTFVGAANFISGVASRPARAGDVIITYGVGFGATNPNVPPGQIVTAANSLPNFTFRFGSSNGEIVYAGLAPNFVGLYQFNIRVPTGLAAGDVPVTVSVDGVNVSQTLFTTVQ